MGIVTTRAMTPDEIWSVETRLARVEQRVIDIDARVNTIVPVTSSVVQLTERVEVVRRDLQQLDNELTEREETNRRERRSSRMALYTLSVTILAALIGAAAVILSSGALH